LSKIANEGLTRASWHRIIYGCVHVATVGVIGLMCSYRRWRQFVYDDLSTYSCHRCRLLICYLLFRGTVLDWFLNWN